MLFLLCAIFLGSLFSVVFKLCQQHGINTEQVILFNYVTALVVSLAPIVWSVVSDPSVQASDYMLEPGIFLLAAMEGIFFMLGFVVMNRSTWRSGVALTTSSARASLILPVILSWALLAQPAPRWIPVILVLVAMLMIMLPAQSIKHPVAVQTGISDELRRKKTVLALGSVFLVYGISDFTLKVVQDAAEKACGGDPVVVGNHMSSLMTIIFLMASLASLVVCYYTESFKKSKVGLKNIQGGVVLGLVNTGCTFCILKALGRMSTGLFYPLYNIGIVIVASLVGVFFFKEKLKWIQIVGIVVAVVAIALFF